MLRPKSHVSHSRTAVAVAEPFAATAPTAAQCTSCGCSDMTTTEPLATATVATLTSTLLPPRPQKHLLLPPRRHLSRPTAPAAAAHPAVVAAAPPVSAPTAAAGPSTFARPGCGSSDGRGSTIRRCAVPLSGALPRSEGAGVSSIWVNRFSCERDALFVKGSDDGISHLLLPKRPHLPLSQWLHHPLVVNAPTTFVGGVPVAQPVPPSGCLDVACQCCGGQIYRCCWYPAVARPQVPLYLRLYLQLHLSMLPRTHLPTTVAMAASPIAPVRINDCTTVAVDL